MKGLYKRYFNSRRILLFVFTTVIALAFSLCLSTSFAAPNEQINYQGKLTDDTGATVADGDYSVVFSLYTVPTAGSDIWTETTSITVTDGLFSIMLGSTTPLTSVDFNQTLYLGVNIDADGEMTPRKILGTVPSAFQAITATNADNANTFDSLATTSFLRADQPDTATSLLTFSGGFIASNATTTNFHISGLFYDADSSEGTPGMVLQTTATGTRWVATSSLNIASGSSITFGTDNQIPFMNAGGTDYDYSNDLTFGSNGGVPELRIGYTNASGGILHLGDDIASLSTDSSDNMRMSSVNDIDIGAENGDITIQAGLGDYINFLGGTETVFNFEGNSLNLTTPNSTYFVIDTFSNVGIGTSTPSAQLDIYGARPDSNPNTDLFAISSSSNQRLLTVNRHGNLGVGTSSPSQKLSVDGDFALTGLFYDADYSIGSPGMVLQTTGTGTRWVATSSLNISSGGGSSTFLGLSDTPASYIANAIPFTNSGATGLTSSSSLTWLNSAHKLVIEGDGEISFNSGYAGKIGFDTSGSSPNFFLNSAGADMTFLTEGFSGSFFFDSGTNGSFNATSTTFNLNAQAGGFFLTTGSGGKFVVDYNGNVGIGTTTPSYKLDVYGNARIDGDLYDAYGSAGSVGMVLQSSASGIQWVATSTLGIANNSAFTTTVGAEAYDLSTAAYEQSFTISSQDTTPAGITFSPDGTKMFMVGSQNDRVYEYTLSIAWDVTSATYVDYYDLFSNSSPTNIQFSSDGTLMYIGVLGVDHIQTYTLSSAFDISTVAGFPSTFDASSEVSVMGGFAFSHDGTNLYVSDRSANDITQYSISTPWDLTTAAYDQEQAITEESFVFAIQFALDGSKMFLVGSGGDRVREYDLSVPYDISTETHVEFFSVSARHNFPNGLALSPEGEHIYVVGETDAYVSEYRLDAASENATYLTNTDANFGIGTTLPTQRLHITGNMRLEGALYDSTNSAGTLGMVLQSTAIGQQWVATSSLNIAGGSSISFGTDNQIPYMNAGGTDYEYSDNFTFDGSQLTVTGDTLLSGSTMLAGPTFYASNANLGSNPFGGQLASVDYVNSRDTSAVSNGNLTYVDADDQGGNALAVWGDGQFIYLANQGAGLHTYSVNGAGSLTYIDFDDQGDEALGVWGDGQFIYLANGTGGLSTYSVDESGNLTLIDSDDQGDSAYDVWGDGKFIYLANGNGGLHTYSVDESGNLTHIDFDDQGDSAYDVWGDGQFIYLANDSGGIHTYSVTSSGMLTHIDSDDQGDSAADVWGDGKFIYLANDSGGLLTYSVSDTGMLTHIDTDDQGDEALGVWGDGKFVYLANAAGGLHTYTVSASGILTHIDVDDQGGTASGVWGDGKFIYLANNTSGLQTYAVDNAYNYDKALAEHSFFGNVGIGTTTPSNLLDIYSSDGSIAFGDITTGSGSTDAGLTMDGGGTTTSSLFTEVDGKILSYGINAPQFTTRSTSTAGGIFRFDTRTGAAGINGNAHAFVVKRFAEGSDTGLDAFIVDLNSGSTALAPSGGDVGIGVIDPDKRLEVFETVADAQFKISYDATRYAQFQVDSVGDLIMSTYGQDVRITDDNLWVCESGSCPAITASSTAGYAIVENGVYFGNGFKIDQISGTTTELGVYNGSGEVIIIFEE